MIISTIDFMNLMVLRICTLQLSIGQYLSGVDGLVPPNVLVELERKVKSRLWVDKVTGFCTTTLKAGHLIR